jgi:hypothetical protein
MFIAIAWKVTRFVTVVLCPEATIDFSPAFQGRDQSSKSSHVASATIERVIQPSLTRRCLVTLALAAFRGRAKIRPPLRVED